MVAPGHRAMATQRLSVGGCCTARSVLVRRYRITTVLLYNFRVTPRISSRISIFYTEALHAPWAADGANRHLSKRPCHARKDGISERFFWLRDDVAAFARHQAVFDLRPVRA